jgi:DNA-binding transcriptional LysR family regulator
MVTLGELVTEPLIVMQPGAGVRSVIDEELRKAGVRARDLKIAMELGLQESAKAAVEAGYGVSFLSQLAVERELRLGLLAVSSVAGIEPTRDFSTVRASGIDLSRTTAAFLAWAKEHVEDGLG